MRVRLPFPGSRFVRGVVALALAWGAGRPALAAERRIELGFPVPELACGIDAGGIHQVPADRRAELASILERTYDDIVAVYGEPMLGTAKRKVDVYFTPGTGAGMYLTHKSEGTLRFAAILLGGFLAGPAGAACGVLSDIPDHAIFIDPDMGDFRNIFLHELIHVFHDRQSYLGWYTHSWVEEGMTEAATELVVDRLRQRGIHDLEGAGVGHSAWDNLKHYDSWSHPSNGAATRYEWSSVLGAQEFYQGSYALLAGGDGSFSMPAVIPSQVRYAAAASVWLMLAKAFSADPASPDFLRRVNARIDERGMRRLSDDRAKARREMVELLEELLPGATMEGLPLGEWLQAQAILKGGPSEDFVFLDVRNPENLRLADQPITAYTVSRVDFSGDFEPAPDHLASAELPARGCSVDVWISDAFGNVVHHGAGTTDGRGAFVVGAGPDLPVGAYSIQAKVGACDRLEDGVGSSHAPGGMYSATYAVVSGETIDGSSAKANAALHGATLRPDHSAVGADAIVETMFPSYRQIDADDTLGYFRAEVADPGFGLDNVLAYVPVELRVGQRAGSDWALRHPRHVFKPSPYTRVVWQDTSPDFSLLLSPASLPVDAPASLRVAVMLFPNGVARRDAPPDCPLDLFAGIVKLPATIKPTLSATHVSPNERAPDVTIVELEVLVGSGTPPGRYTIPVSGHGSKGTCEGLVREAVFTLDVLPPRVAVAVDAVVADAASGSALAVPIRVITTESDETRVTAFVAAARQGTRVTLEAPAEAAGGSLRFLGWEFDHPPGSRSSDNPVSVTATAAFSATARYVSSHSTVLTIDASLDGSSFPISIPVPIRWSWSLPRGGAFAGTDTTRFELRTRTSTTVSLDAPARITVDGREVEFYGWESGGSISSATHLGYFVTANATLVARYRTPRPETVTLTISALCDGCATGTVALAGLPVTVATPALGVRKTPFSFAVPKNGAVALSAPPAVIVSGRSFRFVYWMSVTDWRALTASQTLRGLADKTETLAPVYRP